MADSSKDTQAAADTEPTAAQKVFGLPELLENILQQLPMEDLFLFQSINSTFCDTIKISKPIRLAMHLDIPTERLEPGKSSELFGREFKGKYLIASSALRRAMHPFRLTYACDGVDDSQDTLFRCGSAVDWFYHPIALRGSWRKIKFAWGSSPVRVELFRYQKDARFAPTATIDDVLS